MTYSRSKVEAEISTLMKEKVCSKRDAVELVLKGAEQGKQGAEKAIKEGLADLAAAKKRLDVNEKLLGVETQRLAHARDIKKELEQKHK
ncbi:hypothetical protein AYO40_04915 [Planctomycetaceae bacterium SCGC AG-212-D15]|nr:hypothetical protein AYO40_04915 [Planctomycetaceae bacterium SCGC AG-212-D15]